MVLGSASFPDPVFFLIKNKDTQDQFGNAHKNISFGKKFYIKSIIFLLTTKN